MHNEDLVYGVFYRCPGCNTEHVEAIADAMNQQAGIHCPICGGVWKRAYLNAFRDFGMEHGYPVEQEKSYDGERDLHDRA
jgi:DNA-directed RNA polymerase subunit RPC12/RpoP